jgi:hypothetical protein
MCLPSEQQKNIDNKANDQAMDSRSSCLRQGLWYGTDICIARIEIEMEGGVKAEHQDRGLTTATPEIKFTVSKL